MPGERARALLAHALDGDGPRSGFGVAGRSWRPCGRKPDRALLGLEPRRDRPAARSPMASDFLIRCIAETSTGRQERDGLEKISLSGSVRACEHDEPAFEIEPKIAIVAEMGQRQPADA